MLMCVQNYTEEINKLSRSQGAQIESVLREKDEEMARMKANLAKWKEETAAKIASAMHDEFKAEWERCVQPVPPPRLLPA